MSEEPCMNWGVPEIMLATPEAADLSRAEAGVAPVLFNHDRNQVVGRMENIEFKDGKGYADVIFDEDAKAQEIKAKVESGSLKGVSVGYMRQVVTEVDEGETYLGRFQGPCEVVDKWELLEFSIVSIPADPSVGVGRELENKSQEKGEERMDEKEKNPAQFTADQVKEAEAKARKAAAEEARKAENERIRGIVEMCRRLHIDEKDEERFVNDGLSVADANAQILEIMAKKQAPLDISVKEDSADKFARALKEGVEARFGLGECKDNEARALGNLSLRRMAEECIANEDGSARAKMLTASPENVFRRALSSATFMGIMDDFSHKALQKAYTEVSTVFEQLVSFGSNSDFKPSYRYQTSLDSEPVLMAPESGEFTYMDASDMKISTQVQTYGKGLKLTREMFVNDQLGEVPRLLQQQGRGYKRFQEKMYFNLLTLAKNFSAKNGNLATTAGVSVDAFGEMNRLMKNQKSFDGKGYIGVPAKYIVAPTALEVSMMTILHSTSNPAATNSGVANVFQNAFTLVTSPYLDDHSTTEFYFLADPRDLATIEFTTLNGNRTPISRVEPDTEDLAIRYQSYMDFGFNLLSVQGMVKNPGK